MNLPRAAWVPAMQRVGVLVLLAFGAGGLRRGDSTCAAGGSEAFPQMMTFATSVDDRERSEGSASTSSRPSGPPDPQAGAAPKRRRAASLLLGGKHSEAVSLYGELLAENPGDAQAMTGRVRALMAADRWRDARDEAHRFAAAVPRSDEVRSALGEALYRSGLLREAAVVLEGVVAGEAPAARALLTLGLIRAAEGQNGAAAGLMGRAVAVDPEDRSVLLGAAGEAPTRARAIELLDRYVARSEGDDPDRIEGAKASARLYRALGERRVWVAGERPRKLELILRALADRPGVAAGYVIEMTGASGKPVRLLLDTGSSGLFLVERIALKAGFEPLAEGTTFGGGGKGRDPSRRGLIPAVSFGALKFTDALVTTTKEEIEPTGKYQGVLGLSIFEGYKITLDLAHERMTLELEVRSDPAGEPYWIVEGEMLVEAGAKDGPGGMFLFDTGANRSLLSLDFAASVPGATMSDSGTVRGFAGALRSPRTVRAVRLKYQELETPEAGPVNAVDLTQRSRLGGVEVSGYLGLDFLGRARIVVDTQHRRVSIARSSRK